jgi:hypothetical protein
VSIGRVQAIQAIVECFEELEIKNVFDILGGFSDSINIDIILEVDLEPFKFRLAAIRPRFRVL